MQMFPKVTIQHALGGVETTVEVKPILADGVRYETLARRFNLATGEGNEMTSMASLAFCALLREKRIPAETKLEDWFNSLIAAEAEEEADEKPAEADAEPFRSESLYDDALHPGSENRYTTINLAG